jgi:hypothetical protein
VVGKVAGIPSTHGPIVKRPAGALARTDARQLRALVGCTPDKTGTASD